MKQIKQFCLERESPTLRVKIFIKGDLSNRQKMNNCFFPPDLRENVVGFCLSIGKRLFVNISFQNQQKELRFLLKMGPEIFKIAFRSKG